MVCISRVWGWEALFFLLIATELFRLITLFLGMRFSGRGKNGSRAKPTAQNFPTKGAECVKATCGIWVLRVDVALHPVGNNERQTRGPPGLSTRQLEEVG